MYSFKIFLAEMPIKINCLFPSTAKYCRDYLVECDCKYEIYITEKDIQFEREMAASESPDQYLEILAVFRKIAETLIEENTIVFHSSAIEIDGQAYVFSAPSGTGKSTHTKLWREYFADKRVRMINDDKPLIKIDSDIMVYGTPWRGKERIGENIKAPIIGICFLKQGKSNKIHQIDKEEAIPKLLRQTYRIPNQEKLAKTIVLLNSVAKRIPIYEMSCTISKEAVEIAYNYMNGEIKNEIEE